MKVNKYNILFVLVGLALLVFAIIFISGGFTEETNRQAIRWSARLSGIYFSIAFVGSAIATLFPGHFSKWLLQNRKYWGISFAIVHLIHLAFLVLLQQCFHPVFDLAKSSSLIGGGLAYFFLMFMLLTSFPAFSKRLSSKNWKLLHTLGGYWIWFIFFKSYWKRVSTEIEYLPLVILFGLVIVLRSANFIKQKMFNVV